MATRKQRASQTRSSSSRPAKKKATSKSTSKTAKERKLTVPDEQWGLPISMDAQGRPVSMRDAYAGKAAVLSFAQLSLDQQADLVATRIEQQPNFELSMVGAGVVSKERAIAEVRAQTPVGRTLIEIEQRMISRMAERAEEEQD